MAKTNHTAGQLPADVLRLIFIECLHDTPLRPDTATGLLVFAVVCRHWRYVAVNTASLWTNIELVCHLSPDFINLIVWLSFPAVKTWDKRCAAFAFLCMSRSRAPVSIALDCRHLYSVQIPLTLDCLLSHSQRWKHLRFRVNETVVRPFLDLISLAAPCLKHLDIDRGFQKDVHTYTTGLCLGNAPNLHTLRIAGSRPDLSLSQIQDHAVVKSLRKLEVQFGKVLSLDNHRALLQICPNIEELTISFRRFESYSESIAREIRNAERTGRNEPIVLDQLRALRIDGQLWMLRLLTAEILAPGLTDLEINMQMSNGFSFDDAFILHLLENSSPPLRRLIIDRQYLNPDQAARIVFITPALRTLGLVRCNNGASLIFELLIFRHQALPLLPELEELIIYNDLKSGQADDQLINLIVSRCPPRNHAFVGGNSEGDGSIYRHGQTRLKKVEIVHRNKLGGILTADDFSWLLKNCEIRRCVDDGLEFNLH